MPNAQDRLVALLENANDFTGIDFVQVEVRCDQTVLRIYFLTDLDDLTPKIHQGGNAITRDDVLIYSPSGGLSVEIDPTGLFEFVQETDTCRWYLRVQLKKPGDFSIYRVKITDPRADPDPTSAPFSRIDPFFNDVPFSFKAGCHDVLDCAPVAPDCPPEPFVDFPVDYLARDFVSLKNALLDYAAQRYPQWTLPTDADVGVMLAEIFSAIGDELSYIQDRYGREATLETATERRSLRKKARLVDYEIHDGRLASTFLDLTVTNTDPDPTNTTVPAGKKVYAISDTRPLVVFETGQGIRDARHYPVRLEWNFGEVVPYWLDDSKRCLDIGSTEILVEGDVIDSHHLVSDQPGEERFLLLQTNPDPGIPERRVLVKIVEITRSFDPLFGTAISKIRWADEDALTFQIDQTVLSLSLNIIPATAGETKNVSFLCPNIGDDQTAVETAVEREGPLPRGGGERPTIFLFSLPGTDLGGLGFLGKDLRDTQPEVIVKESGDGGNPWFFTRTLISAASNDEAFTLEDGTWRRIVAYRLLGKEIVHRDYAVGTGYTIRFGDSTFGKIPPRDTLFDVTYKLGPGVLANVPQDTITSLARIDGSGHDLDPLVVTAVRNPLTVTDGVDPESAADIKALTPEAYQAELLFAVRPEDYGTQAERLDWVQRAHGTFRWTGSWLTAFVAADPFGAFTLTPEHRTELENLLDCVRQAGREVDVRDPKFLPIDLKIHVCVEPFAHAGEVLGLVLEVLMGHKGPRPVKGFFDPDNFTFGTPLRRSALEAAIHDVNGVRAVTSIEIRTRGKTAFHEMQPLVFVPAPNEVIRIENDLTHPDRGTVRLFAEGGA